MYAVIENTPGYLPDADEPATFETFAEANAYMREEIERLCDHIVDGDGEPVVSFDGEPETEAHDAFVSDAARAHDLGRVFAVVYYDEDGDA